MQETRRGRSGWLGWLLFALIIFAPRLAGPVATWLSQVTGLNIAPGTVVAGLIGLYVVGAIAAPALRAMARSRSAGDARLPTAPTLPPPAQPPRASQPPGPSQPPRASQPSARLPDSSSPLPGPPRFEPIIDPRVLTFGIIGLFAFGAFLLVALFLAGSLP